ncbi:hypothetical protein [Chitinophaga pinensis]|nr:hypothetical protein [Chitinophaga pinensis]
MKNKKIATGLAPVEQLYDLQKDPGETHNLASQHPEIIKTLKAELKN